MEIDDGTVTEVESQTGATKIQQSTHNPQNTNEGGAAEKLILDMRRLRGSHSPRRSSTSGEVFESLGEAPRPSSSQGRPRAGRVENYLGVKSMDPEKQKGLSHSQLHMVTKPDPAPLRNSDSPSATMPLDLYEESVQPVLEFDQEEEDSEGDKGNN